VNTTLVFYGKFLIRSVILLVSLAGIITVFYIKAWFFVLSAWLSWLFAVDRRFCCFALETIVLASSLEGAFRLSDWFPKVIVWIALK
jgi:hypothetical protein